MKTCLFLIAVLLGAQTPLLRLEAGEIVRLQTRDRLISIRSHEGATQYRIQDLRGTLISDFASEEALRAQDPELFQWLKRAIADPAQDQPQGKPSRDFRDFMDASVDSKYLN